MQKQFERTAMLYGREKIEQLKNRRVAIFGIGGVGGHCAEGLCRTGIGKIDLYDRDIIEVSNINRQIIATHKTVGRSKVEAMRERMLEINPEAEVGAYKLFYLPQTADEVDFTKYDYIIDAVDTVSAKLEIVCRAKTLGIPVISSMGAANKYDPSALEVADIYETSVCPIARVMRNELRKRGVGALKVVYSKETPLKQAFDSAASGEGSVLSGDIKRRPTPASNAFVPAVAGLIIASEVIKDLRS